MCGLLRVYGRDRLIPRDYVVVQTNGTLVVESMTGEDKKKYTTLHYSGQAHSINAYGDPSQLTPTWWCVEFYGNTSTALGSSAARPLGTKPPDDLQRR